MPDQNLSRTDREILRLLAREGEGWHAVPSTIRLSKTKIRELESRGLVEWRQIGSRPNEYRLTSKGRTSVSTSTRSRQV